MISEVYMTAEEAEQISGSNIKALYAKFSDLFSLREKLYKQYNKEDAVMANIDAPTTANIFSPIARYATDIAIGYFIGSPCRYYSRVTTTVKTLEKFGSKRNVFIDKLTDEGSEEDNKDIQAYLAGYQAILRKNHEDEINIGLTRDALIHRAAYERIYIVKDANGNNDIRFKPVDPKKAVLIRDNTVERNPVAFLCREQFREPLTGRFIDQYELITNKRHVFYKFRSVYANSAVDSQQVFDDSQPEEILAEENELNLINLVGIPVVEYRMPNNKGFFEDCIPLLNARDALLNNVRNTFKYNDDAILMMIGFMKPNKEEEAELKETLEKTKTAWMGEDTDMRWLFKDVPIDSVRGYFEILTNDIFGMLGIKNPVKQSEVYQNITTVRYQNYGMDNTIMGLERTFEKSLLEGRARIITAILNYMNKTEWDWEKLDVAFDRNLPSSRVEEAQFIAQMKGADILADEDILDQVQFIENSKDAVRRKREQDEYEAQRLVEQEEAFAVDGEETIVKGFRGKNKKDEEVNSNVEHGDGRLRENRQTNR